MKHWTLCLGVMNIFRGGGERLAVFQPSNIQLSFSRSLSVQQSCVLYLKPVEHPYSSYIHIFSQIFQSRENLQCPLIMLFFHYTSFPALVTLTFCTLLCREIWLWVSGKPVPDPAVAWICSLGCNQRKSHWPKLLGTGSFSSARRQLCMILYMRCG